MNYLSVYDHKTMRRLAFLENAYKIGYSKEENALWTASFTLPATDRKNKYCEHFNYIEIFDNDNYIGLFRIIPTKLTRSANTREITYQCEHVLATLIDDVLLGWHEIGNVGVYTPEVLRYILDRQSVKRWQLQDCDFMRQYLYGWENENLLAALFSVPNAFVDSFVWKFDTTAYPWLISLVSPPSKAKVDIRYRKNMLGITKTSDPTKLATRLYALGYGEGENQLNIASVNPTGQKYLDAKSQTKYGLITKIWIDRRYESPESLYQAAVKMLNTLSEPIVSYEVDTAHIGKLLNSDVGDIVRVADEEDDIDVYKRITKISKSDVTGAPNEAKITLGNPSDNIASSLADMSDRQRVQETYAQGAVTLFTQSFYDNCSPDKPATIRFYIPDNVVHINQVLLKGRAAAFRGYTKATRGGGANATTTSSGGGSSTSTDWGGGTNTSTDGGGAVYTATNTSQYNTNDITISGTTQYGGNSQQNYTGYAKSHRHFYWQPLDHLHGIYLGSHHHQMFHSHEVSIPSHSHNVSIGGHSHSFYIPAHTHSVSIPDHTHDIEYGIYTGTSASQLTLKVDNNVAGTYGSSVNNLNLIAYLSKSKDGKVNRGWHEISIVPDRLTRVEFDLVTQLFANSRGGGQY